MAVTVPKSQSTTVSKRADSKGRVALGAFAIGKEFDVEVNDLGQIILTPMVRIPEREIWLHRNPEALALFREGYSGPKNLDSEMGYPKKPGSHEQKALYVGLQGQSRF